MHIHSAQTICENYFNAFNECSNFRNNDIRTNILALLKFASYLTVIIPLGFGIAYAIDRCIQQKKELSPQDKIVNDASTKILNTQKKPYDLDEVVLKIKTLQIENKKLCLFVGRTNDEQLPQEDNVEWISLDSYFNPDSLIDRLHLRIDFNNAEQREKIYGLFDKVVVDQSVLKFLSDKPWKNLAKILKPSADSELIMEDDPGMICFPVNPSLIKENDYKNALKNYPIEAALDPALREKMDHDFKIKVKGYLQKLFTQVTHEQKKPFPYRTNYCEGQSSFFILKGPKVTGNSR